ncbi:hypothetical protein HRbin27_01368 [bacterium HR27]|nr:hypothetical protein HRbin27_01368 [bacterium HR27]
MVVRVQGTAAKEALRNLAGAIQANPKLATGTTSVRVRWSGGTQAIGQVRSFEPIVIDEPPAFGGTDRGPNPAELLLVALGACQELTLLILAEQLGLRIDDIEVDVHGDLDLRGFLGIDPNIRPGFQHISITVHIASPEPEERLRELLARAERLCPVSDVLRNPVPIETTLALQRTDGVLS